MDWGWIIIFGLAIVGAALIAGGAVAYRGTTTMRAPKVLGAMGIAMGVVMWVIVAMVTPVSNTSTPPPPPQIERQTAAQQDSPYLNLRSGSSLWPGGLMDA